MSTRSVENRSRTYRRRRYAISLFKLYSVMTRLTRVHKLLIHVTEY